MQEGQNFEHGHMSIACYRPKAGKEESLLALTREHIPILRGQGLVTDRAPIVMRAKDGTIVEVFEWTSTAAIGEAHSNPAVQALWVRYNEACDYVSLNSLAESADMFAGFEPVEL